LILPIKGDGDANITVSKCRLMFHYYRNRCRVTSNSNFIPQMELRSRICTTTIWSKERTKKTTLISRKVNWNSTPTEWNWNWTICSTETNCWVSVYITTICVTRDCINISQCSLELYGDKKKNVHRRYNVLYSPRILKYLPNFFSRNVAYGYCLPNINNAY